jgi:hypothetical protein
MQNFPIQQISLDKMGPWVLVEKVEREEKEEKEVYLERRR